MIRRGTGKAALWAWAGPGAALILGACAPAAAPATAKAVSPASAPAGSSLAIEDLTWTELRAQIGAGKTTVIIPVGGVEQSGPAMALGKHDARARLLAQLIAQGLGDALVAPVVAYVPEGDLAPPTGHMRFTGTITTPSTAFRQTLSAAADSFRLHGFTHIVLIGDHGGYQSDLAAVADQLNRRWGPGGAQAHYVAAYYRATQTAYVEILKARGYNDAEIGKHAGLADVSLTLALAPAMVRSDALGDPASRAAAQGVQGDPRRASAALGRLGVEAIVQQSVTAIRAATRAKRSDATE